MLDLSTIVEALVDVAKTIENPSIANILADIVIAKKLVDEFKAGMAGLHPSVSTIFKALV